MIDSLKLMCDDKVVILSILFIQLSLLFPAPLSDFTESDWFWSSRHVIHQYKHEALCLTNNTISLVFHGLMFRHLRIFVVILHFNRRSYIVGADRY